MNREILFRAKGLLKDRWYYGYYLEHKRSMTNYIVDLDEEVMAHQHLINKETLGQYIELADNNGTKIFDGDIVRLYDKISNINWTAIVEFGNPNSEYNWGYQLKPTGTKNCYWNKDILVWIEMPDVECEVIGNIYDNPTLISGENNYE